ncbi:MAG: AMP-binding protein [gamma proteobacterium symbiont of Lucinoma myriamae]|nr:AMP-binding protein [gamma proteobacterium symbiont of Lucinoma myriamae]
MAAMKASEIQFELTLFYRGQCYTWGDLCTKIQSAISKNKINHTVVLITQAQDVFSATLDLLYGFLEKRTVFPVSSEFSTCFSYELADINNSDIALAIATSGSQARPKVALISYQNIESHCQNFVKIIPIDSSSIWLNCMPLSHIAGVMIVYRCWFNNASMVLHENFDTEKVWRDINHYGISHISLVPRMLFKLLELSEDRKPPESLKYVIVGGDKLSDDLYQRAVSAGWPVYISYGMTEASSTIAIGRTPDKLKILDGIETQLSDNNVLEIKGDMIFSGYTDIKKEQFENQWFMTHDRVKLDNNDLSIIGRNDYMIISGGKNIAPEHIESLLERSPVSGDFAIGKIANSSYIDNNAQIQNKDSNQNWGDTIVALFCEEEVQLCVGEEQFSGGIDELKCWLKENIQPAYQPRVILSVKKIPRNSMGKIDRKAVQIIIIIINYYFKK